MSIPVKLRAVLVPVGDEPKVVELDDAVEGLQKAVGGFFDNFTRFELGPGRTADCWCDDEGLLKALPENRLVILPDFEGMIVGPIVITASDGDGETYGLTDDEVRKCLEVARAWLVVE